VISLKLSQVSQIVDGCLYGLDAQIKGICIDSRKVDIGNLFIAIKGNNFDGHDFVASAVQNGAWALLVEKDVNNQVASDVSYIKVKNTIGALAKLATWWRMQFQLPVFAITGSAGKTTTKEMLASVLAKFYGKKHVLATIGNLNNHLGVPLTLLNLDAEHKACVVELGANHVGEIKYLADLVNPTVGIITNVGSAHIGEFGSLEQITNAKSELLDCLKDNSYVILDSTSHSFTVFSKKITNNKLISFGLNANNENVNVTALNLLIEQSCVSFTAQINLDNQVNQFAVKLNLLGEHNITNALAVIAASCALKIPLQIIKEGLAKVQAQNGRGQVIKLGNLTLIDDSYNANYEAVKSAINSLVQFKKPKILVLGELGELGEFTTKYITNLLQYALGVVDYVCLVGEHFSNLKLEPHNKIEKFKNINEVFNYLIKLKSAAVLIKGSRSAHLDKLVNQLKCWFENINLKQTIINV